ncbi:hypothetical protein BH11PAT3_BH11PAT3_2460 [soil metagenome]
MSLNSRIWSGDSTAVAEARANYKEDREKGLIPYASTLYSFRNNKKFALVLFGFQSELRRRAEREMSVEASGLTDEERAGLADVLTTIFEWMIRRFTHDEFESSGFRENWQQFPFLITQLSEWGMKHAIKTNAYHSFCLLKCTQARLYFERDEAEIAEAAVNDAAIDSYCIKDPNQKVRVYAKVGFLYRILGVRMEGYRFGFKALLVQGVPMNVRLKGLALLLGFDR